MTVRRERLELDSSVRRFSNGTALVGGSPLRLVRLSDSGARILDSWLAGAPVELTAPGVALRDRLVTMGMVHPKPEPCQPTGSVGFVVPVHADEDGLGRLLPALRAEFPDAPLIVVDDASPDARPVEEIGLRHGAKVIRHAINGGPGVARNSGWRELVAIDRAAVDIVVFVDADTEPTPGALEALLAHFADDAVTAVAPRICAWEGAGPLNAYEACNSPLDMGPEPALVQPRSRVSYVPSATLAVRTSALASLGGFDETMRVGEDVDLVWRLSQAGRVVRYAPEALVRHRNRPDVAAFARQRFTYGTSAAELAERHGDAVAPFEFDPPTLVICTAIVFGGPRARLLAAVVAVATAIPLARKLDGKLPRAEIARLVGLGHIAMAEGLARALTRAWLPLALMTKRSRRALAVALMVPALVRWVRKRPALDGVSFVAWSTLDDLSYCAGVWTGVYRRRSPAALAPRLRSFSRQ